MVSQPEPHAPERVRLDRWLWAARFYKTRSLAAAAIAGGKVHLSGQRVKRSKMVQVGDALRIRKGIYEYAVIVQGLAERRGRPPSFRPDERSSSRGREDPLRRNGDSSTDGRDWSRQARPHRTDGATPPGSS
jgi:ribosome-associated heat shock protein Hsp15